eukprot:TRINITY_DN37206_c0_g1_i1.p1 TRINITY_DN37206_c0_g1~~TRINITY_DN37206_c0_g1_i1.p1  ORF type:complete len:128 (+),score=33.29 TRINITY_DN37206_c0_g1_i1:52-435(+)
MGCCGSQEKKPANKSTKAKPAVKKTTSAEPIAEQNAAPVVVEPKEDPEPVWEEADTTVKLLTGDILKVKVASVSTIAFMKEKLQEITGECPSNMRLACNGVELTEATRTLGSYRVEKEALIVLLFNE